MRQFINTLCHTLNHLSDTDHSAFHLLIRDAAKAAFGKVKDPDVGDWLHTEDMHADMKGENPVQVQDYRCDTDRTMLSLLINFTEGGRYTKQLMDFKKRLEVPMATMTLTPAYTIETVQEMPWMGARSTLGVLRDEFRRIGMILAKEKVLKREDIEGFIAAVADVEFYFGFGDTLMANSLAKAMTLLKEMYAYMAKYLSRARSKTSRRYEITLFMKQQIDMLLAAM